MLIYHACTNCASIFLSSPVTIVRPTSIKIIAKIFLNHPFGSEAHLRFQMSFCPNTDIASKIIAKPNIYATSAIKPIKNHAGRSIASIIA